MDHFSRPFSTWTCSADQTSRYSITDRVRVRVRIRVRVRVRVRVRQLVLIILTPPRFVIIVDVVGG